MVFMKNHCVCYLTRIQYFCEQEKSPREEGKKICTHIVLRTRHAFLLGKAAALAANSCHFLPNFKHGVSWYLRHFLGVADQNSDKVKSKWVLVEHSSNMSTSSPLKRKKKSEDQINRPKAAGVIHYTPEYLSGSAHPLRKSASPWVLNSSQFVFTTSSVSFTCLFSSTCCKQVQIY